MQGHTDRATINERRPLTKGMAALLAYGKRHDKFLAETAAEKNQARGLMDRGYIVPTGQPNEWTLTDQGRAAT